MKLTLAQLKSLAASAGFQGDDVNVAAAIAMAESTGDPNAYGDAAEGGSLGLWQINLHYHPEYQGDPNQLYTPATNAAAAYKVWLQAGRSFNPWTTYRCPCGSPPAPCTGTPCYMNWYTPDAPPAKFRGRDWALLGAALAAGAGVVALAVEEYRTPGALLPWRA